MSTTMIDTQAALAHRTDVANLRYLFQGYGFTSVYLTDEGDYWRIEVVRLIWDAAPAPYGSGEADRLEALGLPEVKVEPDSHGVDCLIAVEGPTRADVVSRAIRAAWVAADPDYYQSKAA